MSRYTQNDKVEYKYSEGHNIANGNQTDSIHLMRKITLIPGDGIGPEVVDSVIKVIDAVGVKIEWEKVEAGAQALKKYGTVLPEKASTRTAQSAFQYAEVKHRKKITAIHKANIMKLSDGLFLDCARRVSQAAERISTAVHNTVMKSESLTPDLGGVGTTTELTDRIIKEL